MSQTARGRRGVQNKQGGNICICFFTYIHFYDMDGIFFYVAKEEAHIAKMQEKEPAKETAAEKELAKEAAKAAKAEEGWSTASSKKKKK